MPSLHIARRTSVLAALAFTSALATACLESTGPDEHEEPDIAGLTVSPATGSVATGSATLTTSGQAGVLTLRANTANAVTVRVLGQNGQDDPVVVEHSDEFEIRVFQGDTQVATSTSGYPYAVSLTPAQTGTVTYSVRVFALEHGHEEFVRPLVVTVATQ